MDKQLRNIIIGIIVLIVLIGGYFCVKKYVENSEAKQAQEEEDEKVYITDFSVDNVTGFSYGYEGTTYKFSKTDNVWTLDNNPQMEISTVSIETLLGGISHLQADEVLGEVEDVDEYGLKTPVNTITVSMSDGTEYVYYVGSYNTITAKDYFQVMGDACVYTVSTDALSGFSEDASTYAVVPEEDTSTEDTTAEDTTAEDTITEAP